MFVPLFNLYHNSPAECYKTLKLRELELLACGPTASTEQSGGNLLGSYLGGLGGGGGHAVETLALGSRRLLMPTAAMT